jgi:electron transport complex protein RnfC
MAKAFFGGVHPNDMKAATNEKAIEQLAPPAQVVIPMSMHFGAPCTPLVKKGDHVKIGQKIGEFKGLGAPIHASVSGTVAAVEPRPYSMGGKITSVVIDNDFLDEISEEVQAPADPDALSVEEMIEIVKNAGIVGMGGATFPTHVKISGGIGQVDTVIINGAECEPYITGDHRAMLERPEEIIGGCCYLAKMFGVEKVIIGVEDNKQNGIDALNKVIAEQKAPVVVQPLHCRYPQGGEKQLCQAITGKQVPPGGLPSAIGCAVFNINTTCAIYRAITTGMPVVRKVVTVSGSGVIEPKNLECPIGTPVSLLFDACGGLKDTTFKLIAGGPMMGMAQYTADISVAKGTGAILAFAEDENKKVVDPTCMRCGRCVEACPMHLEPL